MEELKTELAAIPGYREPKTVEVQKEILKSHKGGTERATALNLKRLVKAV